MTRTTQPTNVRHKVVNLQGYSDTARAQLLDTLGNEGWLLFQVVENRAYLTKKSMARQATSRREISDARV